MSSSRFTGRMPGECRERFRISVLAIRYIGPESQPAEGHRPQSSARPVEITGSHCLNGKLRFRGISSAIALTASNVADSIKVCECSCLE